MGGGDHLNLRILALGASVFVAIAAGTPYLYGLYLPQLMRRCGFTTSDSATVSVFMNIGVGVAGFPGGVIVDSIGPLWGILVGACSIFTGYYGTYKLYETASNNLFLLCMFMAFVGMGSTMCFFCTLKATQLNFPNHRGSAGALPVSSYGLSATIFSFISAAFFANKPGSFIEFLGIFCGTVTFVGSWFVHVYHNDENEIALSDLDSTLSRPHEEVLLLSRNGSSTDLTSTVTMPVAPSLSKNATSNSVFNSENSTSSTFVDSTPSVARESAVRQPLPEQPQIPSRSRFDSLRGSLSFWGIGSRSPRPSVSSSYSPIGSVRPSAPMDIVRSYLTNKDFLLHYVIISIISGSCQMYIYTVGFIVIAQIHFGDNTKVDDPNFSKRGPMVPSDPKAASMQAVQVSIISISSFTGRLCSGILSDYIYKKHQLQRLWIVSTTLIVLILGELVVMYNTQTKLISLTSIMIGGSYGLTFGTYPAIIADKFGAKNFTTGWGLICTGPLVSLFILNKYFGILYDLNTDHNTGICYKGNRCYLGAFEVAVALAAMTLILTLYVIRILRKPRLDLGV